MSDGTHTAVGAVAIQDIGVTISRGATDVTNNSQNPTTIWDGQNVNLSVTLSNAGNNAATYSWSYTGNPIKTYDIVSNTITKLTQTDLQGSTASWYYYNASGLEGAGVTVNVAGTSATIGTFFTVNRGATGVPRYAASISIC